MKRAVATLMALAMVLIYQPLPLFAQANMGQISGTSVVDGAPLPNTSVRLRNVDTGQLVGTTTSNTMGEYSFQGLPAGNYIVETVAPNGTVLGTSAAVSLAPGAMAATGVAVSTTATAAAAAGVGGGAAGAAAAAGGGSFFASTAGIITIAAVAAGVTAAAVAVQDDASPSQ